MKVSDCEYLIGKHLFGEQRLDNTLEAVSDFICDKGMVDDLEITTPDGKLVLDTYGIYINSCPDQVYLDQLLPVLILKQMELDGTKYEQEL